jgi:hypothetical protein
LAAAGIGGESGCARGEQEKRQTCEACGMFQHLEKISFKDSNLSLPKSRYPKESIGFTLEFPNSEKLFPELGI